LVCGHKGSVAELKYYEVLAKSAALGEVVIAIGARRSTDVDAWIRFVSRFGASRKIFVNPNPRAFRFGVGDEA
jgi:hypothetical protein